MRVETSLILAGFLASAVLACDPGGPPPTSAAVPDTADQVLWEVTHWITLDGVRRIKIESDTVYVYEMSQLLELHGVRVEFYSEEGGLSSTVTSREGTYELRSENMEARGDVVARTPDGRVLTTEILRFDRASERISGPEAFVFDSPDRHLEGDGFTSDPDFRDVSATGARAGRIRGTSGQR
ncbi:MAG: LPS export ABC transporter periplasmic protein LptC [Gemmatimonadales bacterium]|jgi:LPS export ABC transporter protein LptC